MKHDFSEPERRAEWYDRTITGYVLVASLISIGLGGVMVLGVV